MEEALHAAEVVAAVVVVAVVASDEKISTRHDCTMSSKSHTAKLLQFRNLANLLFQFR